LQTAGVKNSFYYILGIYYIHRLYMPTRKVFVFLVVVKFELILLLDS